MDKDQKERLTKADQCALLLLADLREVHANADSVAVEELMSQAIQNVAGLSRLLGRLARE